MNVDIDTATARLRAVDPVAPDFAADPHGPIAQAMAERIVAAPASQAPPRRGRRRIVLAATTAAAAVAAVVTAGVIVTPWSHGRPTAAAYAVDKHADGSIVVSVHWDDLYDPAKLNAELERVGARTVVMAMSSPGECTTPVAVDAAHPTTVFVDVDEHPELRDPAKLRAYLLTRSPWIDELPDENALFTIHPDAMPAGDTLLIQYQFGDGPEAAQVSWLATMPVLVTHVPSCIPSPVITGSTAAKAR